MLLNLNGEEILEFETKELGFVGSFLFFEVFENLDLFVQNFRSNVIFSMNFMYWIKKRGKDIMLSLLIEVSLSSST